MSNAGMTVFICTSCRTTDQSAPSAGRALIDAIESTLHAQTGATVSIEAVECLSVCKRPCTVAFAARGKWTYVIGDLDPVQHADDLITMSLKYAESATGIVPWRERPIVFRKGIISRVPPLPVPA